MHDQQAVRLWFSIPTEQRRQQRSLCRETYNEQNAAWRGSALPRTTRRLTCCLSNCISFALETSDPTSSELLIKQLSVPGLIPASLARGVSMGVECGALSLYTVAAPLICTASPAVIAQTILFFFPSPSLPQGVVPFCDSEPPVLLPCSVPRYSQ